MDKDKLNLFVRNLVNRNRREELDVLWSFLFSGCKTGFKKYTDEAKEHFAKVFKRSLEAKYREADPFEIIDNVTKPIEIDMGGLNVNDLDYDRTILAQALLSNSADRILIDELKRRVEELKEADKRVLDLILGFIKIKKSDSPEYDAMKEVKYVELRFSEVCTFLHDFQGTDKNPNELAHLLISNGFMLSPYIGSGAAYSTSEKVVIPLLLLETYVEDFLPTTLISKITSWQEKVEERIERAEEERKIEYSSWARSLREKEEAQEQVEHKLSSYILELMALVHLNR